jgi:hypothetical protein
MAGDIKLPAGKFIVDESGYGLVGYYGTASATFGNPNRGINLRGNATRPQYNSLDIAMCPVLLWENSAGSDANITFNKTISVGDILEIWYSFNSNQPMAIRCKYTKDDTCIPISQSFISLQGTTYYLRVHNSDLYITSTGISQKYGYYAFLKLGGDGSNVSQNGAVNGEKAMIFAVYKV